MNDSGTLSTVIHSNSVEEQLVRLVGWLPQVAFTCCSA